MLRSSCVLAGAVLALNASVAAAQSQQVLAEGTEYRANFVYSAPIQVACIRTELRHDGAAVDAARSMSQPILARADLVVQGAVTGLVENVVPIAISGRLPCYQAERTNAGMCRWQAVRDRTMATVVVSIRVASDPDAIARVCQSNGGEWRSGRDVTSAAALQRAREIDELMAQLVRDRSSAPPSQSAPETRPRNRDALDTTTLDLGTLPFDGSHDAVAPIEVTIVVSRSPIGVPERDLRAGNFAFGITTTVTTAGSIRGFPARVYSDAEAAPLLRFLPRIVRAGQPVTDQRAVVRVRVRRVLPAGGFDLEFLGISARTRLAEPYVAPQLR